MQAKTVVNMKALRIAVLSVFVLSIAITVWSMLSMHNHMLHIAHVALITLTFLLIALYLYKSAEIASLTAYRELRLRLTVDPDAGFIEYMRTGAPIFNACAGALARKGIYVRSAESMTGLAKLGTIAISGNSESREGYAVTVSTLAEMGAELYGDTDACPVKLALGPFDPETGTELDFVLTSDKITHVLIAVYISRMFARLSKWNMALMICALAAAAALSVFEYYTYAGAAIAIWAASCVLSVRRVERKTARLTFKSVASYRL